MISKLNLYNFRTRAVEPFVPIAQPVVGYYTCGPTVYDTAHIGNLRTYIYEDVLKRALTHFGYNVTHVMNLTDVEDKIIRDANIAGSDISSYTAPFIEKFYTDLAKLNIIPASVYPRATKHIPEMIELIQRLIKKGIAYEAEGSVYFAIRKFADYGKLSGIALSGLKAGARVDVDEYDKDAAEDFVLWKASKPEDEAVGAVWDSPWGKGRPGWHIECSAMSMKYLGETFDLHAGAIDLLFPHHEDEVAQAEAATDKPFANVFVEGEHILVDGHKMAKSAKNFYTLDDLLARGIDPLAFRYLVLTSHYQAKLNFTWESLQGATQTLARLRANQYRRAKSITQELADQLDEALGNNLDIPGVLAILHTENNPALWEKYDEVLGLGLTQNMFPVTAELSHLLEERERARQAKNYARADEIRNELLIRGLEIEDTPEGARLVPTA